MPFESRSASSSASASLAEALHAQAPEGGAEDAAVDRDDRLQTRAGIGVEDDRLVAVERVAVEHGHRGRLRSFGARVVPLR